MRSFSFRKGVRRCSSTGSTTFATGNSQAGRIPIRSMSQSRTWVERPHDRKVGHVLVRRASRLTWAFCGLSALFAACSLIGLRLNLTGSMPVGIYIVARDVPTRGSIVLACLSRDIAEMARARGYLSRGGSCPGSVPPVGKPVLAVPGDTIVATATGLVLNGVPVMNSKPLSSDRRGRPLPRLPAGRYPVGPDEFWLLSDYSRFSFDSRYFGAVKTGQVRAHVRALWTAGSQP